MDEEKMDARELTEKELGHHELTDEELAQVSGGTGDGSPDPTIYAGPSPDTRDADGSGGFFGPPPAA